MRTRVVHRLTGYDRSSDELVFECDIPRREMARVKAIARVVAEDPDAAGSYPLEPAQAREIASMLGRSIDTDNLVFFLEPFNMGQPKRSGRGAA
jgi:hypothetical protein